MASDGSIIICDYGNHCIRKIAAEDGTVTTIAGVVVQKGHRDGDAASALFYYPIGVVVASDESIIICDVYNHCIRQLTLSQCSSTK